jgi:Mrp family chromosome partitioning ATPase
VIGLADAPLLGSSVEGVIYVLEAKSIQAGMVRMALGRLRAAQLNILGVIVTKLELGRDSIGYGYGYDYNYAA